jgi:hypothetical protein
LALAPPPRDLEDELLERRPLLVSVRAAERFALLTRAAKPARPFEEEPALVLLTTLASAACLMRAGELRWDLLGDGQLCDGVESPSIEEELGDGLAFLLPFPFELEGRRCIRPARRVKTEGFSTVYVVVKDGRVGGIGCQTSSQFSVYIL